MKLQSSTFPSLSSAILNSSHKLLIPELLKAVNIKGTIYLQCSYFQVQITQENVHRKGHPGIGYLSRPDIVLITSEVIQVSQSILFKLPKQAVFTYTWPIEDSPCCILQNSYVTGSMFKYGIVHFGNFVISSEFNHSFWYFPFAEGMLEQK